MMDTEAQHAAKRIVPGVMCVGAVNLTDDQGLAWGQDRPRLPRLIIQVVNSTLLEQGP